MTERLFDRNSFIKEFRATVTQCLDREDRFAVVLDQTAFFPEGGGQRGDTGFLNENRVLDTQEEDGVIYHSMKKPLPVNHLVAGKIDWEQRFSRMQNHTGEHIISGLVNRLYGYHNVGFHLNDEEVTMDYDGFLDETALQKIELLANQVIAEDIPIKAWYPEKPEEIVYRSKRALTGKIRLVEIPGVDVCACCAPHVERTGQVGMLKLTEAQRYKGGIRLHMKCGFRALYEIREYRRCLEQLSRLLSLPWAETVQGVEKLKRRLVESEWKYQQTALLLLKEQLAQKEYRGGNLCVFISDEALLKEAAAIVKEKCSGIAGVFCGSDEAGYRYMILSSSFLSCEKKAEIQAALRARGGGDSFVLQGHANQCRKEIEKYFFTE